MEKKEVLLIIVIVAGAFFLLNGNSLTGLQVFRLFSPGGYSQPSSITGDGSRVDEVCAFYGYNEEVANSCNNCLFDAFNILEGISRDGRSIEGLRVNPCVTDPEEGYYFSRGYVSATIR